MSVVTLEHVERQRARGFRFLRFFPEIEACFRKDYAAERVRLAVIWGIVGTVIYDLVYFGDRTMMADVFSGLVTARFFVPYQIEHPVWMLGFLVLTALTFSLFGFIIGLWADDFQKLQVIPLMVVTPLTFLGGAFYSIDMLPPFWQRVTLFNPVVYLISGFRWSFYGIADVDVATSAFATLGFLALCLVAVWWIFRTGYKLRS